jgi:hypothetical protein
VTFRSRDRLAISLVAFAASVGAGIAHAQIILPPVNPAPPPPPGPEQPPGGGKQPSYSNKSPKGVYTRTFKLKRANDKQRMVVLCPHGQFPFGGGMFNTPSVRSDGEGIYPHSYERLGVQKGFHATTVFWNGESSGSPTRYVTLQVACSKQWTGHVTPPHRTKYVPPGQTRTVVAKCPGHRHLMGGGFQRTDFVGRGGDYVTESRATSSKNWRVTASAFGGFGGEITAIAYCLHSKKPLLTQVSSPTVTVAKGTVGYARTPPCPKGRRLVYGGFQTFPQKAAFMTDGRFLKDRSWSAAAYNNFGPTASLTAYGYCFKR